MSDDIGDLGSIDIERVDADACMRDFFVFVQEFWDEIINEPPVWNWHIEYLCDELQQVAERVFRREAKLYDLIINVPPGSTKSTICSQLFPVWCWVRDDTLRLICGSHGKDLAMEQSEYSLKILQSEKFRRLFPDVVTASSTPRVSNYRLKSGGQRLSTSVGSSPIGFHAHFHIVDDPIDPKKAVSKVGLKTANDWMDRTLSQRKVDRAVTVLILVMQRLHADDPSGHALRIRPQTIRHICLPAEVSELVSPPDLASMYVDGLFDVVRLPRKVLDDQLPLLGTFGYAGQMSQNPVPAEGGVWKNDWFQTVSMNDVVGMCQKYLGKPVPVWMFPVDSAYTKNEMNDPCGWLAYARVGPYVIISNACTSWLDQPSFERELPKWCLANSYSKDSLVMIEPKANGISTVQNLRARTKLNVIGGKAPTVDKYARAQGIAPSIESGRVLLVDGLWIEDFKDQVCLFPFALHDEWVDCVVMAVERELAAGLSDGGKVKQFAAAEAAGDAEAEAAWAGMV